MNSHKLNMYAGAIIGSVLFFLLLNFFTDLIYVGRGHSEHEQLAFAVEVEGEAHGESTADAIDYAALVAAADAGAGEKLFGKCKACHQVAEGVNGVGPSLWGVVGRDIGSVDGYSYSGTLAEMEGAWTLEALSDFLESPKGYAPGTKMGFAGLKKPEDRVDMIVYLNQSGGAPIDLAPAGAMDSGSDSSAPAATEHAATEPATTEATVTEPAATETAAVETAAEPAATEPAAEPAAEPDAGAVTETAAAPTAATETAAAAGGDGISALLASADAAAGEKVFRKCKACHTVEEGKNRVGPSLWGVVGRAVGGAESFAYSDAMMGKGGSWTLADLDSFLEDPKGTVPGNKMTFPGLKKAQDRIDVIVYLNEADGSPEPLQ